MENLTLLTYTIRSTLNPWLQSEGFKRDFITMIQYIKIECVYELK